MFKKIKGPLAVALLALVCSSSFAAQLINVNTADAVTLAENLNGIGTAKAKAIVEYRKLHGNFQGVGDLIKVKGIGSKLVERNSAVISFGTSTGVSAGNDSIKPTTATKTLTGGSTSTPVLPADN